MALLTAKADPLSILGDIDTTQGGTDAILSSYRRTSSSRAFVTLPSQAPGSSYVLAVSGSSLPSSLVSPSFFDLLFIAGARIGSFTIAPSDDPSNVIFAWDGQGESFSLLSLQDALGSGDPGQLLNLLLSGTDLLRADYADVDVSAFNQLENIALLANALNAKGNDSSNMIDGNDADNQFEGGGGNDTLNGGGGRDRAVYRGAFAEYSINDDGNGAVQIVDQVAGRDGSDRLLGIEELVFSDRIVPVDTGDAAFSIAGTPAVGNTLIATNTTADPNGNGAFTYTWQSSSDGSSWSNIGSGISYTVVAADEGKQLRLQVSYSDGQGFSETINTFAGSVPVQAVPPRIIGITIQGTQAILQFSEAIDPIGLNAARTRFAATVGGASRTVSSLAPVSGDASRLALTLSGTAATSSQAVTIRYTDVSAGNDTTGVVQSTAGVDLATTPAPLNADTFSSSASVTSLAATYTNLILTGTSAINGSGNANANTITGNGSVNVLTGAGGIDSMDGGNGGDIYIVAAAADHAAAEINDTGSIGSDELRFSTTTANQTLTVFAADRGLERVTIGTGTAVTATTTGTTALNIDAALAPNALQITGNAGANRLIGTAFNDSLIGNGGNDSLTGGEGNDLLDGGAGTDTMDGGQGSDIYLIATATEHSAAEIRDSGTTGSDELRFASTSSGQTLTIYAADTGIERVTIGTGTVTTPVSTGTTALNINAAAAPNGLEILGNNGANTLTGTAFADVISGNGGNDTLRGGLGNDSLTGGGGADVFRFDTALNAVSNVDRITDFTPTTSTTSSDRIQLENTGTGLFTAITATGTLASTAFRVGTTFTSTAQRIRYDSGSGNLFYDPDGSGSQASILFATLNPGLAMTNSQFVVT